MSDVHVEAYTMPQHRHCLLPEQIRAVRFRGRLERSGSCDVRLIRTRKWFSWSTLQACSGM